VPSATSRPVCASVRYDRLVSDKLSRCLNVCGALLVPRYKGIAPSLLRELSYSSIRFGLFVPVKQLLGAEDDATTPFWKKLVAGGTVGALGSGLASPADLLKARMQASVPGTVHQSMFGHARGILVQDGLFGLWKGACT